MRSWLRARKVTLTVFSSTYVANKLAFLLDTDPHVKVQVCSAADANSWQGRFRFKAFPQTLKMPQSLTCIYQLTLIRMQYSLSLKVTGHT
jgi:hypothetical protein